MFFDWMVFCGTKNGSSMASLDEPFKGTLNCFLEISSLSNSPRVKELSLTIFESIQPISGSSGSTFSVA